MSMYTEVFFRAEVRKEVAEFMQEVTKDPMTFEELAEEDGTEYESLAAAFEAKLSRQLLDSLADSGDTAVNNILRGTAEFFQTSRWPFVFAGTGHFLIEEEEYADSVDGQQRWVSLSFRSVLKNYDFEIEGFFAWVSSFVREPSFVGYSLVEFLTDSSTIFPELYYVVEKHDHKDSSDDVNSHEHVDCVDNANTMHTVKFLPETAD